MSKSKSISQDNSISGRDIFNPILLSLGSNIGNRIENINRVVQFSLSRNLIRDLTISSYYETEPYGYAHQEWFINIALVGHTAHTPFELLSFFKSIENEIGRKARPKWQEREIDIDILILGDNIINSEHITIPHPDMHNRKFVLIPASEIAGELIHPKFNINIFSLLAKCKDKSVVRKI